jgi:tetratricopeptide (TPR) repeat protein
MIQGFARQFRLCCVAVVITITAATSQSSAAGGVDSADQAGRADQAGSAKKKLIAEYNHGDFKLAEASGRLALTQQPTDMEIRYYLANTLSKLGKADEAIFEYRQCLNSNASAQLKEFSKQGLEKLLQQKEASLAAALKSPAHQKETELNAFQKRLTDEQIQAENSLRDELTQAKRLASERYSSRMRHSPRDYSPTSYQQSASDANFYQRELRALDEEYFRKVADLRNHAANALSQTNCGKSTIRVMPSLSSSKVKNYINYSDEVEAPVKPLPESMSATALSLGSSVKPKKRAVASGKAK